MVHNEQIRKPFEQYAEILSLFVVRIMVHNEQIRKPFEQYAEILTSSLVTSITANGLWRLKDEIKKKALWSQAPCFTDNLQMQRKSVIFFCGSVISRMTAFCALPPIFRCVCKIAKNDYNLRHVSPSVRMDLGSHGTDFHGSWYLVIF